MKPKTIVIVGLGLMGASLALAMRKVFPSAEILGLSRRRQSIQNARKKRIIDQGFTKIRPAVCRADVIFVCTPVDVTLDYLAEIDRHAPDKTIVTDVGSVKGRIVSRVDRMKLKKIRFVGSHPMAGSHLRGMDNRVPGLYRGACVFVTPGRRTDQLALREVVRLWKKIGANPVLKSPAEHDRIVSAVSHLPHAIASALVRTIPEKFLRFSGPGFLDTTRVSQGDPRLWVPIFGLNHQNLIKDLSAFQKNLNQITLLLKKKNSRSLFRFLARCSAIRARV